MSVTAIWSIPTARVTATMPYMPALRGSAEANWLESVVAPPAAVTPVIRSRRDPDPRAQDPFPTTTDYRRSGRPDGEAASGSSPFLAQRYAQMLPPRAAALLHAHADVAYRRSTDLTMELLGDYPPIDLRV